MTTQTVVDFNRTYTVDEFMRLSFEGDKNAELIGGKIVVAPPPGDEHGRVADEIRHRLSLFDPERKLGKVWMNSRFRITPQNAPAPDLAFVVASRVPPRSTGVVDVVPDLAVEVISPSDELKDIKNKINLYQEGNIRLLWIIWPDKKQVDVYEQGIKTPIATLTINDLLEGGEVIPGFSMPVAALFED